MSRSAQPTGNEVDFSKMTKAELLEFAKNNGIDGVDGSMLKADILEVITNIYN